MKGRELGVKLLNGYVCADIQISLYLVLHRELYEYTRQEFIYHRGQLDEALY